MERLSFDLRDLLIQFQLAIYLYSYFPLSYIYCIQSQKRDSQYLPRHILPTRDCSIGSQAKPVQYLYRHWVNLLNTRADSFSWLSPDGIDNPGSLTRVDSIQMDRNEKQAQAQHKWSGHGAESI